MGLKQWLGSALLLLLWSAMTLFAQDAGELKLSGRYRFLGAGLASSELKSSTSTPKKSLSPARRWTPAGNHHQRGLLCDYRKKKVADQTTDPPK
jgi:hypothetical protein